MGWSFVSKTVVVEEEIMQWTTEEKKETSSRYGCEILFERTTLSQVKDPSLPNDAYLILYRSSAVLPASSSLRWLRSLRSKRRY